MATVKSQKMGAQIVYFDTEGRQNLTEVVRVLKRLLKKREDLRTRKIVVFTAFGEGPSVLFNKLADVPIQPKIIAVTFPRTYMLIRKDGERFNPKISDGLLKIFADVGIDVIVPPALPFDMIEGLEGHNQQMKIIGRTISMFGAGFGLCVQAVLRACDMGHIEEGETVIAMSGDIAGLFTASTTAHFLNSEMGLGVQEIFCKPRKLTISRPRPAEKKLIEAAPAQTTVSRDHQISSSDTF